MSRHVSLIIMCLKHAAYNDSLSYTRPAGVKRRGVDAGDFSTDRLLTLAGKVSDPPKQRSIVAGGLQGSHLQFEFGNRGIFHLQGPFQRPDLAIKIIHQFTFQSPLLAGCIQLIVPKIVFITDTVESSGSGNSKGYALGSHVSFTKKPFNV